MAIRLALDTFAALARIAQAVRIAVAIFADSLLGRAYIHVITIVLLQAVFRLALAVTVAVALSAHATVALTNQALKVTGALPEYAYLVHAREGRVAVRGIWAVALLKALAAIVSLCEIVCAVASDARRVMVSGAL